MPRDSRKKKLLLVEDEAIVALDERARLEGAGYEVLVAGSGEEAVRMVLEEDRAVDLVLMDINLGDGMDGTEAAKAILARARIPIVFLSSHTEEEVVRRTEEITSFGYIVKNSGIRVLDASIKMALKLFSAIERLSILNEVIAQANKAEDSSTLFELAVKAVLRLLDYDAGGVYVIVPGAAEARVAYSVDLPADFLDAVRTVPIAGERYRGLFLEGKPLISDHYDDIAPENAAMTGFRSLVSVPIVSRGRVAGALNVISKKRYETAADETSMLMAIGEELGTMLERVGAEERIRRLMGEKDTILKEVHHRVRNYMNTILSMISLKREALSETAAVPPLQDIEGCVRSMRVLYDKLYCARAEDSSGDGPAAIMIGDYLSTLVREIIGIFPAGQSVRVEDDIEAFALDPRKIPPLGILVNELITNAMKYAFFGREEGRIGIRVRREGGEVLLVFEDDGPGIPEAVLAGGSQGFGLQLVDLLVGQLKGKLKIDTSRGTRFEIRFKE